MSSKQFEHVQRIRQDFYEGSKRLKNSSHNSIRTLADDLYNKHTHFIFELIQNAEDNTYAERNTYPPFISFRLTKTDPTNSPGSDGALIIQNNETGFNPDNVDAICAVGETTKKKEQGYIGEKGIGFKSVFRVTDNPHIFSNGYYFCLPESDPETELGYIVPQWIDTLPEGLVSSDTYIILPLTKSDFGYDKIEIILRDIEPEVILFLYTLEEIRIETDTGDDLTILKDSATMPEVAIIVEGNKQGSAFSNSDNFLVCTKYFNKPVDIHHEKREGIENREVSIALPLNGDSTAGGKIFAYLPIRSDTGFPFLINADFILPSSREDIQDVPWNRWLIDCAADLIVEELLPLLKEQGHLRVNFLKKLSSRLNSLAEDERNLFYPIFTRVSEAFMSEEFLPVNDETFVSAENAKLADSEALINLLNPNQLSLLFEKSGTIKWLLSDITARRTPDLWKYLRDELEIDIVDPDMFARRIDKPFLEQQDDDWFINFYKFLSVGPRPPKSLWCYSYSILRRKPILRLQDNSLVNPNEPNVYLSKGTGSEITSQLIKVEISQNEDAHKFLRELGISKWNIVAEVIGHVLPKYRDNSVTVPISEYNRDFANIVTAYKADSQTEKDRLRKELRITPFILAESANEQNPDYCEPNELYFGTDELRLYFQGNNAYKFVSSKYPDKHIGMFKELGISDKIKITCESEPGATDDVYLSREFRCYRHGLKGFDPNIKVVGLKHALMNPSVEKSKIIWERIVKPYSHCIKGKILRSSRQDFSVQASIYEENEFISDFGRILMENAWLPDSNGDMHTPRDISLAELPEEFMRDERLANQLGMKKDEVAELAEKSGVSAEVIRDLMENPEEYKEFKEWKSKKIRLEQSSSPETEESKSKTRPHQVDYPVEIEKSFNKSGKTEVQPHTVDSGRVNNPERRREKIAEEHSDRLNREPSADDRRRETYRTLLEGPDPQVREYLFQMYGGKCQICDHTFPERDGEPFFVASYIVERQKSGAVDTAANALCLCADHFAKFKHGAIEAEDVPTQIENFQTEFEGGDCEPMLDIKLCGEKCEIRFKEKHLLDLQELIKVSSED